MKFAKLRYGLVFHPLSFSGALVSKMQGRGIPIDGDARCCQNNETFIWSHYVLKGIITNCVIGR